MILRARVDGSLHHTGVPDRCHPRHGRRRRSDGLDAHVPEPAFRQQNDEKVLVLNAGELDRAAQFLRGFDLRRVHTLERAVDPHHRAADTEAAAVGRLAVAADAAAHRHSQPRGLAASPDLDVDRVATGAGEQ